MDLFDEKYSKNNNIVKYYYNINMFSIWIYFSHLFLWCKALQSSVSHSSEIKLICRFATFIIIRVENACVA